LLLAVLLAALAVHGVSPLTAAHILRILLHALQEVLERSSTRAKFVIEGALSLGQSLLSIISSSEQFVCCMSKVNQVQQGEGKTGGHAPTTFPTILPAA
jgi:hypothetical protein